ncbi:fatty acid desaturase [Streptomyces fungicidicus]|uniref:fatty acid desaturase n=1 Tax=Streptomyces fungicidicus TaxID=68203 RepID=UPI00385124C9
MDQDRRPDPRPHLPLLEAPRLPDLCRQTGRERLVEGTLLVALVAGYVTLFLTTMPLAHALVFAALHQALFGLHLGMAFAPNHKGMDMPDPDGERWGHLRLQVLTSRNLRDCLLTDWFLGALNYQIEHHLFPKHAPPAPEARPVHGEGPLPRPRPTLRGDRLRRLLPSGPAAHVRSG